MGNNGDVYYATFRVSHRGVHGDSDRQQNRTMSQRFELTCKRNVTSYTMAGVNEPRA